MKKLCIYIGDGDTEQDYIYLTRVPMKGECIQLNDGAEVYVEEVIHYNIQNIRSKDESVAEITFLKRQ